MSALVIAEHDRNILKGGTANAVTAAAKMGGDVHVLVAGSGAKGAAVCYAISSSLGVGGGFVYTTRTMGLVIPWSAWNFAYQSFRSRVVIA